MAGQGGFITVTISGGEQLALRARQLATWGQSMQSLEPAWTLVGEDLLGDFAQNMIQEGGFFGSANGPKNMGEAFFGGNYWPPLAASTLREKERLGYGGMPMLQREGHLLESLSRRGAPGNIFETGPNSLAVGTSIGYAGFHQNGTRKMPSRRIVGIAWSRRDGILKRLNTYVQEMARQAGLSMGRGV